MVDRGKSKLCKAMDHINENKSVNLQINYENGIYLRSQTNVNIIENLITNRKKLVFVPFRSPHVNYSQLKTSARF